MVWGPLMALQRPFAEASGGKLYCLRGPAPALHPVLRLLGSLGTGQAATRSRGFPTGNREPQRATCSNVAYFPFLLSLQPFTSQANLTISHPNENLTMVSYCPQDKTSSFYYPPCPGPGIPPPESIPNFLPRPQTFWAVVIWEVSRHVLSVN